MILYIYFFFRIGSIFGFGLGLGLENKGAIIESTKKNYERERKKNQSYYFKGYLFYPKITILLDFRTNQTKKR